MQIPHKQLRGRERLHNVIKCLSESCPWTKSITSETMMGFLESELKELKDELVIMNSLKTTHHNEKINNNADNKKEIVSEVGDIIFDVLMLEMAIRREYGIDMEEAWQAAAEKVERRTPYIKEWGDGVTTASTVEDTEKIWQQVKKKEKMRVEAAAAAAAASESSSSVITNNQIGTDRNGEGDKADKSTSNNISQSPRRSRNFGIQLYSNGKRSIEKLKENGTVVGTAALAFTLGAFVSRLMLGRGIR